VSRDGRIAPYSSVLFVLICALSTAFSFGARAPYAAGSGPSEVYALLRAVGLNLRVAGQWLDDGDFDSAAETVERAKLLLIFCEFQSREESWLAQVAMVRSQCDQLIALAKDKDAGACAELAKNCLTALASLEATAPDERSVKVDELNPPDQIRSFMKLLNGSYSDAKLAKSFDELNAMTYVIAETTNVVQFLKSDSDWRERACDVRDAALKVARLKSDTDLKVARQELKNVYERCQACHQAFRR
jgi:hypothetical protein